jgi:predicted house-cleaning noncanonical NTP pyrophosphatase (MazG superfamily)
MKRIAYHKLVRDKIPQIIEASGRRAVVQTAGRETRMLLLEEKLKEELEEYLKCRELEELADLLEVMHGVVDHAGLTWEELESLRLKKRQERGGFEEGIVLLEVVEE